MVGEGAQASSMDIYAYSATIKALMKCFKNAGVLETWGQRGQLPPTFA